MLMQIREKATGIIAYIIVILIAIPFALWGIHDYFGGPSDQNVAEVNGEEIIKRAFDAQLQDQRSYLRSLYGAQADDIFGEDDSNLKQQVLDGMIQNILINEEVNKAGYRTSNARLFERIRSIPQFQKDGQFDVQTYENILAAQARSPIDFEAQMRNEDNVSQYQGSIVFSSFLPGSNKQQYAMLTNQAREFDYFLITADSQEIEVTDQEIEEYYQANKDSFQTPAQVKLDYIEIDQNKISSELEFNEQELLVIYEQNKPQYQTEELRKARHILFKLPADATDEQVDAALSRGQIAVERISAGEDFSDVAADMSEDQFTAKNGGDLGYLARNDIDNPEFIQKLFSMDTGESSHAMRTGLGVQIVKLEDITEPTQKSFEEARSYIENSLRAEVSSKEFSEQAQTLEELAYENDSSLQVPAEVLDVDVQSTDWVSAQGSEGIAAYPKVIEAAFSEDVLDNRYNSDLLELHDGHVAVVRVTDYKEPQIKSLNEVSDVIQQILVANKARQKVAGAGKNAINQLQSNSDNAAEIAAAVSSQIESPGAVYRDDESVPSAIIEHVFAMNKPAESVNTVDGLQLINGDYVVIILKEVEVAEGGSVKQGQWISVQNNYGQRERAAVIKALRETADVRVYSENL